MIYYDQRDMEWKEVTNTSIKIHWTLTAQLRRWLLSWDLLGIFSITLFGPDWTSCVSWHKVSEIQKGFCFILFNFLNPSTSLLKTNKQQKPGSCPVAHRCLKLAKHLLQLPKSWDHRLAAPSFTRAGVFSAQGLLLLSHTLAPQSSLLM